MAQGREFFPEIKYHLLRSLFTSETSSAQANVLFDQFDGGSENRNYPNFSFLAELVENEGIEVQASRLVTGHSHNEGDAAIKAPRRACDSTALRCLGDVVSAMLSASKSGKPPIVVIVRDIHDWAARANAAKNPYLKHIRDPHAWKISPSSPGLHPGLLYKDSYKSRDWLGADGVPDGRPVDLFIDNPTLSSRPSLFPRFRNPFSASVTAATQTAIKTIRPINPLCADKLASVLASGGSDSSLGLSYKREFKNGEIGFPGFLETSNGGPVKVRVLAGLPAELWGWSKSRARPASMPVIGSSISAVPAPVANKPAVILTDEPPTVERKARRGQGDGKSVFPWICSCGKGYKSGLDSKRAVTHRARCVSSVSAAASASTSARKEVEDSEEEEGDDMEEDGAEDDEDEDGDEDEDAVDEEEKSTDEGQAEGEGLSTATRLKRKQALAADSSSQVGKADKRRRNSVQLQAVEIQKEYWGPPKPHRHALTQRLYTVKFDDGSIQVVLAEDTLNSKAVVVDHLPNYQTVISQWREKHPPPSKPASEGKKGSSTTRGRRTKN